MRGLQPAVSAVCAMVLACGASEAQTTAGAQRELAELSATVEQLRAEVALLRRTVARLEFERRLDNIRQIKTELEAVRSEQARLSELDQARQQDLRDLEELLARGDLAPGARPEVEDTRAELAIARQGEIDIQTEAARVRESELVRRLEAEEHWAKRLQEGQKLSEERTQ